MFSTPRIHLSLAIGQPEGRTVFQRASLRRIAIRMLAGLFCFTCLADSASAQVSARSASASIEVPAEIKVAAAVLSRLQLRVNLGGNAPVHTMLLVRGLPSGVTLSDGRPFNAGVWVVPMTALDKLKIVSERGISGTTVVSFEVVTLDGNVLTSARSALIIDAQTAEQHTGGIEPSNANSLVPMNGTLNGPPATERASVGSQGAPRPPVAVPAETVSKARKLTERAEENMATGKVTSARLLYEAAVDLGWAPAAIDLAKSYDPNELKRSPAMRGVQPNAALAQKWYEKAIELGSAEAGRRLQALQAAR
jgi:hypothetical protein